ncbi:hypothetical protein [Sporolactobacillus pectinivorans]|uniref:hypothetical protein n=1 Tax=Sporolactobacillus pectinivorans TaxID=1591408 RepID=UPI0013902BB5|nr:hypothetical protein [Sporolactobacillus pectinivorans]
MSSNKFLRIQMDSDFDRERRNRVFLLALNGLVHNQLIAADQNRMVKHSHIVERMAIYQFNRITSVCEQLI